MAASKSTAPVAVLQQQEQEQEQQQHPMPYARRKRFVEQEASIYEIMTWGSAAAPSSPARPAEPSSVHGMKTRSQAAAQQEAATAAAATATALLKKKLQREATAAKLKASSIALAPVAAAPIQSPWATKTLQPARGGAGRKQQEAGVAVVAPGAGPAVVVTNAHRSSKALFPYPHTPGKAKAVVAAAAAAAEEQAAVQGKTRQLSDTAFAKKYQKPVFLGASPAKSPVATGGQQQQESVQSVQQPRVRQVWPKAAAAAAATGAAGSAPVVAMGRTPVKGTKTPGTAKGDKGTATATGGKKSGRGKSGGGRKQPQPPMQVEEEASVLASVEAGYRDFVAALEREREVFQQQTRRTTRSSSGAGGNVVVLASTPAGKARRGSKTPPAAAAVGTEGAMGEFVVVEHADAPAAEVAKALAAAAAAVAAVGNGNEASLSLDDTADTATVVGRSEGAEAALTVLKSKAARRKKGKKAYDEEDEASDSEGEALKTDPRAYRKWVERIPVAGTRVVKGLSVADCFEG